MSIKKLCFMLLSALSLVALLNGCGSSSKDGTVNLGGVAKVDEAATCRVCHATTPDPVSAQPILADYLASPHNTDNAGCQGCHGGGAQHNGVGPLPFPNPAASDRCKECHSKAPAAAVATNFVGNCAPCHTENGKGSVHAARKISALPNANDCVGCHDVAAPQHGPNLVGDNNGVRAIVSEFSKRSHHITGAAPTNAQCVVCHLEGMVSGTAVVIDPTKHMADAKIHLRNADTNADFVWGGTEHTNMDNFCFSCHDIDGAAGVPAAFAGVAGFTGTASNPFGDTLTNSYDLVTRARVVDVKTAFTTTNASHHAVSGQRYQYRFSTLANAQAWAARNGKPVPAASEIAEGHTVGDVTSPFGTGLTYDPAGPEEGGEATLYEADKFVATYIPLGAVQNVADNSTLHCGDCHTVGQWKVASSTNADGSATAVAIGAHGSANEYLLRNSLGTDTIHNNLTYVCFNCHKTAIAPATAALWAEQVAAGLISSTAAVPIWKAGWNTLHPNILPAQISGYASAHAVSAFHIQCQADSADNINDIANPKGFDNLSSVRLQRSWRPQTVKIYDYIPFPGATATAPLGGSNASSGNITGIACTNCHNSGLRSGWGGIHGGNNTYTDGLQRTQTTYRFMPGMGNYRYAPPGGWDGKDVSDPSLVTLPSAGVGAGKPMGGCYTNGAVGGVNQDRNSAGGITYGVCNHHGTSTAQTSAGLRAIFPTRLTYGGGSTSTPTAREPTVREATAGGTLVTRPLKY